MVCLASQADEPMGLLLRPRKELKRHVSLHHARHTPKVLATAIAHRDLEVHHLVGVRAHLVVEAELVFTRLLCCKDGIHLTLLAILHYDVVAGAPDAIIHVERSA